MTDVAAKVVDGSREAQIRAAESDVFSGFNPNTGEPIVVHGNPGAVSVESVGQHPVVYRGDGTPGGAPTDSITGALEQIANPQGGAGGAGGTGAKAPDLVAAAKDVGQGIVETPAAMIAGATKGVNEALDLVEEIADKIPGPMVEWSGFDGDPKTPQEIGLRFESGADYKARTGQANLLPRVPEVMPPVDSATGKFVESTSQFLTGMLAGGRLLRGAKLAGATGMAVKGMAQGAISDFAFFDGQEANLSALIQGTPLANPVTEMLATGKDTPDLVGRLKHSAEGMGLGVLTDSLVGAVRSIARAKAARAMHPEGHLPEDGEQAMAQLSQAQYRETAGDPEGDLFRSKMDAAAAEMDAAGKTSGAPRIGEAPDRVGLNMARVDTPEDVAKILTRTEDMNQDALARAVGYRSWKDADAAAGGLDGYRLLMERQAGRAFTDVEALAARKTDLAAFASVRDAAQAYRASPTPANAAALREVWVKAYAIHKELIGARAEAGRALAVWRMTVDQGDAKAAFRAMDQAFKNGGAETADELSRRVLTLDMVADPEAALKFNEKSVLARGRAMIAEAYQGALLSSPKTQVVNILGNTANVAYSIFERAGAERFTQLLGTADSLEVGEAAAMAFGARAGFADALRYTFKVMHANARLAAGRTLKRVEDVQAALEAKAAARGDLLKMTGRKDEGFDPAITAKNAGLEDVPVVGAATNALGALVRLPGNAMAFGDDIFKLVNHRAELHAQAFRQAAKEVRDGILGREGLGQRIADLVTDPSDDLTDLARRAAEDRTFTAPPGQGARVALSARRWMNEATPVPVGTMLLPFINTPANIMGYVFRRTPLAPLFKRYRDAVAAGGAEADLANTQMAMGTMAALLMADYAMAGKVTGAEPTEPSQRDLWRRSGIQPYSMKVGDNWVAYNRAEPVGTIMSLGADMAQLFAETPLESDDDRNTQMDEAFAASAGAIGNMILNKSYLSSLGGTVEYLGDPQRYGESWLSSLVAPAVAPNIVRDIERITDPQMREASNLIESVKGRVPGESKDVTPKVDLWGRPVMQTSDLGPVYDALVPVPIRAEHQAPIDRELLRLQADISMPTKQISVDGVDVGLRNRPDIYNDMVKTAGSVVRLPRYYNMTMFDYLNALVSGKLDDSELYRSKLDSRGVTDRNDDEKTDVIHKVMRDYREAAREIIKQKYARDLQEMADRKRRTLVTVDR